MQSIKKIILAVIIAALAIGGYYFFVLGRERNESLGNGFISGNGRIEATEIDISTKLPGRIEKILAVEGDFVNEGELLAVMQTDTLNAQLEEAYAQHQKTIADERSAQAQVVLRQSDKKVTEALVDERLSDLNAAQRRYNRQKTLVGKDAVSVQSFEDYESSLNNAKAALESAKAQVLVSQAAIDSAKADVSGKQAAIKEAEAKIKLVKTDIADCHLTTPTSGRIQYRIAQPGEVLAAGGKVLNLVDLSDVYITFFLPEMAVGKVKIGSEVRIVLDAAPDYIIPAKISYVASVAQFTPKTVETQSERQKLMFRVKGRIDPELLREHIEIVKTGLPGLAWVKLDSEAEWPVSLAIRESQ